MAQVNITVNNQKFLIACEDGQEDRLLDLSKIVDDKVGELAAQVGQVGQTRLLVMAALVIADELVDLRETVKLTPVQNSDDTSVSAVACIEELSRRIEKIADLAAEALKRTTGRLLCDPTGRIISGAIKHPLGTTSARIVVLV